MDTRRRKADISSLPILVPVVAMLVFSKDIVVAVEQGQSLVNNTFDMLHALTLTHSGDRRNNCQGGLSKVSLRRIGELHERRTDGGRRARGGHGAFGFFCLVVGRVEGNYEKKSFGGSGGFGRC